MNGIVKKALKYWCLPILLLIGISGFSQNKHDNQQDLQMLADNVFHLSEVMLHDVTNPPAASRVYAYAMLGAYQAASLAKGRIPQLNQKLKFDPRIELVTPPKKINISFCSNY